MSTCTNGHGGRRIVALLFDLGDTVVVEESEVKDAEGTTLRADLIPGAAEALRWFKRNRNTRFPRLKN